MAHASHALLLEPDDEVASTLGTILLSENVECARAVTGDDGWRMLARRRPDVVFIGLSTPGLDLFFRRLRDEYMGRNPRLVAIASPSELEPHIASMDLDAILLKPVEPALIVAAVGDRLIGATVALDVNRLREMLRLTCLGSEFQKAIDSIARRLILVYGVNNCVVLATASERQWVGSAGEPLPPEAWPELWVRCDQAVNAGAPLLSAQDTDPRITPTSRVETRFAAPICGPSGAVLGAICLFANGPRLFSAEARDALSDLASRFGRELSWRSVHDRVQAERNQLRESAMLDPMLGIHSRAALELALSTEIGRYHRNREALSVAVVDIVGLREINDRYGHLVGDAALKHTASTTRRLVRAQDIVGRFGGDEIAILLPSTDLRGAGRLLVRLREAIQSEAFEVGEGLTLSVGLSVGVTEYGGKDDDGAALLVRAAAAAYAAKRRGEEIGYAQAGSDDEARLPQEDRFEAGVTLGGMYEIVHEISRGAMGVVYRAEDLGLSRPVALKMLRPDLTRDTDLVKKFRAEAGVLASLNHENLVRVYAFVEDKDDVFFVMELVEGLSLDGVIRETLESDQYLAVGRVKSIIEQVSDALDAMHHAGVMHRDVKPGNIVMDRARDRAVLVDVGLAQRFGEKGEPGGTPGFIAPESFRGGPETPATDVYGLAATTYTLLTGRAPFGRSDDYREILRRQLDERPALPSSYRSDLTADVDLTLLRGLTIDRRERYSSAGAFAQELSAAFANVIDTTAPRLSEEVDFGGDTTNLSTLRPLPTKDESKRTLTLNLDLIPPAEPQTPEPLTRGIVFRGAARVLGMRTANAWVRSIARSDRQLADAMSLRTSPMAWVPAELFMSLLAAVAASGRNPAAFSKRLGATVVAQTFRRFYPSSPESLSPAATLSALDILWRRYHTWGELDLSRDAQGYAIVTYDGPESEPVCSFIEGWLHQVVAMSGGAKPKVNHGECKHQGAATCKFAVRWGKREPAAKPPRPPPN